MFCRKCGANIPDDSMFCTKCGAKLEVVNNTLGDNIVNNESNSDKMSNDTSSNMPKQTGIDKRVIFAGIAFLVLGFTLFRGVLFYNILSALIMLIATAIVLPAFKSRHYAKVVVCIIVGLALLFVVNILKEMHKKEVREAVKNDSFSSFSFFPNLSFTKKGIDINDIKNIDMKKEKKLQVYSSGGDSFWLLKDKTKKISDSKYSVAVEVKSLKNTSVVRVVEIDINKDTIKATGICEFDKNYVCQKVEAIEDSRESNIPKNSSFANVAAYLKSGNSNASEPIIERNIVDLDKYKWGMSREEVRVQNPNLWDVSYDGRIEPGLAMRTSNLFVGGQKIDYLTFRFVDNKLTEIILDMEGNLGFGSPQDYLENQKFNKLLNNSHKLVSYLNNRLGDSVKNESLFIDNNKIDKNSKDCKNIYYWWTSGSLITVELSKLPILGEYCYLYEIILRVK